MRSKIFLLSVILVSIFILSCNSQADDADIEGTVTCSKIFINSVEILNDSDSAPVVQILPPSPGSCIGLLRCSSTPADSCMLPGSVASCKFNASGADVGIEKGGYCLNPLCEPVPCNNSPVEGCAGECSFHENGNWAGYMKGKYCYDKNDGYKGIDGTGIKMVFVRVNISSTTDITEICYGTVKMRIDNYESRDKYAIKLAKPGECLTNPGAKSAVWTGNFTMHYWEKPGFYKIGTDAINSCASSDYKSVHFKYLSSAQLCVAPENININYGVMSCKMNNVTAYGDMNMGDCNQSDLSSPEATIRNIGNTIVNAMVKSTDFICTSPGCGDFIPATRTSPFIMRGHLYIDLGNGWNDLQTEFEKMYFMPHCNCMDYYGIPPGPHATNSLNLMINPMKCVKAGAYKQTFTIIPDTDTEEECCQDNREQRYPGDNTCILPPQCYEIPGRYPYGTNCSR